MNIATPVYAHKLAAINAESWQAWRLGERESDAIALDAPASLDDALTQAMCGISFSPGDTLAVLYSHTGRRKNTLRLYTVRKSARNYRWRESYNGGRAVKVHALEPRLICETAVEAFAPTPRFDAFRDDAAGRDLTLVEGAVR